MAEPATRSGSRHDDPRLLDWVASVHAAHDAGLAAAFDAPEQTGIPAIQLAPSEGRLLELLMRLVRAERVVEVGTLAGYSAIRLARGMVPDGRLWTIESDPGHAEIARQRIEAAGLSVQVEVLVGTGVDILPTLEGHGPFDAVFIDADKISYPHYGRWATRHLREGGLLIGDNAHLFGQLLDDSEQGAAMRRFHQEAAAAFESVCLPTPEGMLIGIKRPLHGDSISGK